jgi:hypothetical protein
MMRARARLNDQLDPRVGGGEHGWWQPCDELGASGSDPASLDTMNFNVTVDPAVRDPVSGAPTTAPICARSRPSKRVNKVHN